MHASCAPAAIPARTRETTSKNPTGASEGKNAGPAKKNDGSGKRKKQLGTARNTKKKKVEREEACGSEEEARGSEEDASSSEQDEEEEDSTGGSPPSLQGKVVSELEPAWFAPGVRVNATATVLRGWLGQLKQPKTGLKAELQARLYKKLVLAAGAVPAEYVNDRLWLWDDLYNQVGHRCS